MKPHPIAWRFTDDERTALLARYSSGKSPYELATAYGISRQSVVALVNQAGPPRQYVRKSKYPDVTIHHPADAAPYSSKADQVIAVPADDGGENFGRLSRYLPLMDDFIESARKVPLLGIEAGTWISFLCLHADSADPESIIEALQRLLEAKSAPAAEDQDEWIITLLHELGDLTGSSV
ncbi:hypothetical protein [Rudaeicoccus suwonensis]|uniref:hypothetical protein n=1 Tax=Rudaeicoccus suwonensis TaxID=657409 RepID=UPI00119D779A|nr:hypothetical protein [Rudaeicoccus suwonensis]